MGKVWFVDVVTEYGPGHSVPLHVTLERSAELLNANYMAVVDEDCPPSIGTEKWQRVLHHSPNLHLESLSQFLTQRQFYRAVLEIKTQIITFIELSIRMRSLLDHIDNDADSIVVYLDLATPLQIMAIWLSVATLRDKRNKTIIWTHFHRFSRWPETKLGRITRWLFNIYPVRTWKTTFTNELAAEFREYGWDIDVLPLPINPALTAVGSHKSSEKPARLICWLLITRPEQGRDLLPNMISHKSASTFPKHFIKCFISEWANVKESDDIELVRLPYGSKDYHFHFNNCDVVLLPYKAQRFRSGMSMVFIEAVATCKLPIVSDGTPMATELRRFNLSELVMDFDNKFSWTVVNELSESINIRERFKVMAERYNREHDTFAFSESVYRSLKQYNAKIALTEPKRT
jgi:hypothetical protein